MNFSLPSKLKEIYPFDSHWLMTQSGHKMHYVDEGSGIPIIMVHGNPTWSFFYRNLVIGLRHNYRCIVPDHVGCGLSEKPQNYSYVLQNHIDNLVHLVKCLKLQEFHLVIHDWGGPIGLGMARLFPEKVKKITILNTAAFSSNQISKRIHFCRTPFIGNLLVRGFNAFAFCATFMAVKKPLNSLVKKGYLFPYNNWRNRIAIAKFIHDIPLLNKHPSWNILKDIEHNLSLFNKKSIMICWGAKDFCFNDYYLKEWLKRFFDVRLHRFAQAGHYLLEDAPEEVLESLRDFLKD